MKHEMELCTNMARKMEDGRDYYRYTVVTKTMPEASGSDKKQITTTVWSIDADGKRAKDVTTDQQWNELLNTYAKMSQVGDFRDAVAQHHSVIVAMAG